jgi:DNA topoisomerase-1
VDGKWVRSNGKPVDKATAARLKALVIPPAWTNVRLNPDPKGELQAKGVDAKGRDVSMYSAEHAAQASAEKFARLNEFNKVAMDTKAAAIKDMNNAALPARTRDAAAIVALIAETGFRPGSDRNTGAEKQAYGASNLLGSHVTVAGDKISFNFTGKKGVDQVHDVVSRDLARYIQGRKDEVGNSRLFRVDENQARDYLKSKAGDNFKLKDYRTWNGTVTAIRAIAGMKAPTTKTEYTKSRVAVGKIVSAKLGNNYNEALKSYIAPEVFHKWGFHAN